MNMNRFPVETETVGAVDHSFYLGNETPPGCKWGHKPLWHGPAHEFVSFGRAVLEMPGRAWDHKPEDCPETTGEWLFDGTVMVCPGCGLDCT